MVGSGVDISRGVKDSVISVKRDTELAFDNEKIPGFDSSFIPMDYFYSFEQVYKNILTLTRTRSNKAIQQHCCMWQ
jgi:hypothetical protein